MGKASYRLPGSDRIGNMRSEPNIVQRVELKDLLAITRMTFANMTGVDRYFTRMTRNPIGWWFTFCTLPVYLSISGHGYKAMQGKRIVGCAYLHLRQVSAYVFNVNVDHPFRGQGVGRRLMEYLETVAKSHGRNWMALQVDDGNQPAQRLYEKLDYRPYQPKFLRRDSSWPFRRSAEIGVSVQRLSRRRGRRLFAHYTNIERQTGDLWAAPVLDDYDLGSLDGNSFWQCFLKGEEIGSATLVVDSGRLQIKLACQPTYWGHPTSARLIQMLEAQFGSKPQTLDVFLASSAHFEAASPLLSEIGFHPRSQQRILMIKALIPIRDI